MVATGGNSGHVTSDHLLKQVCDRESSITQCAVGVQSSNPQATVGFDNQAVRIPGGYRRDSTGDELLRLV